MEVLPGKVRVSRMSTREVLASIDSGLFKKQRYIVIIQLKGENHFGKSGHPTKVGEQ
jgi:hypothetical protein